MKVKRSKHKKAERTTCMYVRNIPLHIKTFYKAYCAKRDMTMSEDIICHMEEKTKIARKEMLEEDEDY